MDAADSAASRAMRGFAVVAIAIAGFLFSMTPLAERLDHAVLDLQWSMLRKFAPRPAPNDIIIVGVDERSARSLQEPAGLWHHPIGIALERVAAARPKAIGLALTLPERSFENFHPGLDRALFEGLAAARRNGTLVATLAIDAHTRGARPIHTPFLAILGDEGMGIGLLGRDEDGRTRRFSLAIPTEDGSFPTFAGRLCRAVARDCQEGLLDFALGPAYQYVPLRRLLENPAPSFLENLFRDRIVLLGDVQRFGDRIAVPVNLAGWEDGSDTSPTVVVHAHSLRSAMHRPAREASRPWVMLLVAAGASVAFLRRGLGMFAWGALVAVALFAVTLVLLHRGTFVPASAAMATAVLGPLAYWASGLRIRVFRPAG
jgi:CHASE2 domain-containing sensor protein